jgi:hypothetical protein
VISCWAVNNTSTATSRVTMGRRTRSG